MNGMDRRALFTSGAAAALLAATGVSLAATPRRGGRLRVAVPRGEGHALPAMQSAVFESLTEIAPDGVLRGRLATGWASDAEARRWRFDLREDSQFHDGQPFAPEDAVASLTQHPLGDRLGLRRAEITGPAQITLELVAGNPQLPYLLSDPDLPMLRQADAGQEGESTIGTGLYQIRRYSPGRDFLGQRVAQHPLDGQLGWFDSVELVVIPDPAIRAEALRDGFVDMAELPRADLLHEQDRIAFHPADGDPHLAVNRRVSIPPVVGTRAPLDDGRIAERWWMA